MVRVFGVGDVVCFVVSSRSLNTVTAVDLLVFDKFVDCGFKSRGLLS